MNEILKNTNIYKLEDLIGYLLKNHKPDYVYRGQNKRWTDPLVPSLYRGMVNKNKFTDYSSQNRLYEIGNVFHELATGQNINLPKNWNERWNANGYLKQYFGYPLSHLLSQQFGIYSEGLDVTSDPMIAAFFATFQHINSQINNEELGIIYRFKVPLFNKEPSELISSNFYTVNNFLDANTVLKSISSCSTWEESLESFLEFGFETSKILASTNSPAIRPFHILKLPKGVLNDSRIIRQKAGLIFPDMILSKFYRNIKVHAPLGKAEKEGTNAIEDMQYRDNLDVFYFEHTKEDFDLININKEYLFPKYDPFYVLLKSFLTSFIAPGNVIFITEGGTFFSSDSWKLIQ